VQRAINSSRRVLLVVWCVCDLGTSTMSRPMSDFVLTLQKKIITNRFKNLKHAALISPQPLKVRASAIFLLLTVGN
jgi:hypothetical protein